MIQREYHDKTTWGAGAWLSEPDEMFWMADCGLPCVAVRNLWGAWTGGVGVFPSHPLYMIQYPNPSYDRFTCHGGVSWAGFNPTADQEFYPPGRMWWIGFSCMTSKDAIPNKQLNGEPPPLHQKKSRKKQTYRTLTYLWKHATELAQELSNIDV